MSRSQKCGARSCGLKTRNRVLPKNGLLYPWVQQPKCGWKGFRIDAITAHNSRVAFGREKELKGLTRTSQTDSPWR